MVLRRMYILQWIQEGLKAIAPGIRVDDMSCFFDYKNTVDLGGLILVLFYFECLCSIMKYAKQKYRGIMRR